MWVFNPIDRFSVNVTSAFFWKALASQTKHLRHNIRRIFHAALLSFPVQLSANRILRALLHFSQNFSNCSNTLKNCKTSRWHLWQIICNTPIIFCCITSDDRTDDNVLKNSLLFFPKTLILDRPLVLKSILQILQKSLGTMLVSFSGVFIPGLLLGNTAANYPANSMLDPD